jgi:hypothetical protein
LELELNISETSNGAAGWPYVFRAGPEGSSSGNLAGFLTANVEKAQRDLAPVADYDETAVNLTKPVRTNPAALAPLGFINEATIPMTIPANTDEVSIHVDVDQGAVGRGTFPRYCEVTVHNDPDYWLDDHDPMEPLPQPELLLTFLGGCLMDTTNLHFGYNEQHYYTVFNSGRIVENGVGDYNFVDMGHPYFQGMYIFGVSPGRLCWTIVSWIEGSGETSTWNSWLPEVHDGQCKPLLAEDVELGNYSSDGIDYSNVIVGNTVYYPSLDSVQNFWDDELEDNWDHSNFIAPFDNDSTMGLAMEHLTIGVTDFGYDDGNGILALFDRMTLEIIDFTERNGRSLPGWFIASYNDWDIGAVDTSRLDRSSSLAWTYDTDASGSRDVGGTIKIPFNYCTNTEDPNYIEPMHSSMLMDQNQGMWPDATEVYYLDSVWGYAQMPPGEYSQQEFRAQSQADQAASYVFNHHDFTPNETYRLGFVQFQMANQAGATDADQKPRPMGQLAHLVNKWMGFGRGDVNNDLVIDMMDIIYLSNYVAFGSPGPIPFEYLGDVNVNGTTDLTDVGLIADFYFNGGGCFGGEWTIGELQ